MPDGDVSQAEDMRIYPFKAERVKPFQALRSELTPLLDEAGRVEWLEERPAAWEQFLTSQVDAARAIPLMRHALSHAFGYRVYPDDTVNQEDVDDLGARMEKVRQAGRFCQHRDRVRGRPIRSVRPARAAGPDG
jgi:hypothetical protein